MADGLTQEEFRRSSIPSHKESARLDRRAAPSSMTRPTPLEGRTRRIRPCWSPYLPGRFSDRTLADVSFRQFPLLPPL